MASESSRATSGDDIPAVALSPVTLNKVPLKIMDPSRKKLESLESQWVLGVLDECIRGLELVSLLPSELTSALSLSLGQEIVTSLSEHLYLTEKYRGLCVDTDPKQHKALATALQNSLLNVLRLLKACPTAEAGLKGAGPITEDQQWAQELVTGLLELRSVLLDKLLTTSSEERERNRHIQEVSMRHHSNLEVIAKLEKEVAAATKDRDEEISKKNDVIWRLKVCLHQTEKTAEDFVDRTQKEAENMYESLQKTSEGKQIRLQQEASKLRAQLQSLITEHRKTETVLRKKKYKVETEIENWIQKYEAEFGEKQVELEQMSEVYEEERAEFNTLLEQYSVLELEYSQIMEERRIAQERRDEEERETERKSHAAVIIQAFWRGAQVRKAMRANGKSKKSKKNKGKKQK
ncbi:dynein regulatory complex protein 10 [Hoplias malabaricus]|uniref:dynein regulatory complex protein 10 n=1 Tax=Hoplias malabaricus TaxID=27720 RepID=UPI003461A811